MQCLSGDIYRFIGRQKRNSIGNIFSMNGNSLIEKIQELANTYPKIEFSENAGIKELQLKSNFDKWSILSSYYEN